MIDNGINNIISERSDNSMSKRVNSKIALLFIAIIALIILITILIVEAFMDHSKGTPLDTMVMVDEKINFDVDYSIEGLTPELPTVKALIEDNFMKYLKKAYILFGEYPDCEYYKISPNVARNSFDWDYDFRVNSGGLYYTYFDGDEDKGRVGIDVSEFQGAINWESVKSAGVDVAIIRAGYRGYGSGRILSDNLVNTNISGALSAGLDVGVYFFSAAINYEEGVEEAEFCLDLIKDYNITQPVIIDSEIIAEDETARSNDISIEDRTAAVKGFCETVEAAGYTAMIYGSRDQFIRYLNEDDIGQYEFWLASYDTTDFPYHAEGYQYSRYGYVDGISTYVDLDVWMR